MSLTRRAQATPVPSRTNPPASANPPYNRSRSTLVPGCRHGADAGLTSLDWLLLIGAVAGLAALGVVLVQQAVDHSASTVAKHSTRLETALIAAQELQLDWRAETPASEPDAERLNQQYTAKCYQLGIIFKDVSLLIDTKYGIFEPTGPGWHPRGQPSCLFAIPKNSQLGRSLARGRT